MRELWATGWMQQSVRMVAAAFLTEYLGINWVEGALCFWRGGGEALPRTAATSKIPFHPRTRNIQHTRTRARAHTHKHTHTSTHTHTCTRTPALAPGARWFHDTLVDADLAINSMLWQNAGEIAAPR